MDAPLPLLSRGDTIGVMAPSSHVEREDIERVARFVEARGYKVFIHPQSYEREHQSAGTPAKKAEAFHQLWARDDIKAIWAAGGGNRCLHLLDHLDFETLSNTAPKAVIGFSDVTALLNALYAHVQISSLHATVFKTADKTPQIDQLFQLLNGENVSMPLGGAEILNAGIAHGHLIGGNLSLFQYLPQTLSGEFWRGGILFLEECNEELSHIDRMLLHLKRIGVFDKISGLLLGSFSESKDTGRPFGYSLEDIIREHTKDLNIPVIIDAPFGHKEDLHPLAIGMHATLDTHQRILTHPTKLKPSHT